ncbi:MAG: CvpA family protein [Lentimicrobiaceae bacterium]|nr:CvpA family protein [Lentimicrobiaceae bacterium]
MNVLDIILGAFLILFLINGYRKGLIISITSLIAWIAALYVALRYSYITANILKRFIVNASEGTIQIVAFFVSFIIVVVLIILIGGWLSNILKTVGLGFLNRIAGMILGLLTGAFIASCILFVINKYDVNRTIIKNKARQNSIMYKPIVKIAPSVFPFVSKYYKEIKKEVHPKSKQKTNIPEPDSTGVDSTNVGTIEL